MTNENLMEKAMKNAGIENVTVIFRGNDYLVGIEKIEEQGFDLEIKNPIKPVRTDDIIQMVMTIDGKRHFIILKVSGIKLENGKFLIEAKIVKEVPLEIKGKLDEIMEALRFFNTRKFFRIDMDDETLQNFNIIQKAKIIMPKKEYVAYMKNISEKGINFLTTKNFMDENAEIYILNINFSNPAESITVLGKILRRNIINISGTEFAEAAMELTRNIYLEKRIMEYIKKKENKNSLSVFKG